MAKKHVVHLDGRTLEGGGQLLRIALGLSALTGTPIEIDNIRGSRPSGGGLKAQHLTCTDWLATACNAKTTGARKGSTTLLFEPGKLDGTSSAYHKRSAPDEPDAYQTVIDIGTAGSTGLVLQAILPYILFAPPTSDGAVQIHLTIAGGTNVSGSPSYEYISQVLLPTLQSIGLPRMNTTLVSRGWSQGRATTGAFMLDISIDKPTILPAFRLCPQDTEQLPAKPGVDKSKNPRLQATFLGPCHVHRYLKTQLVLFVQQVFGASYVESSDLLSIICEDSDEDKRLYLIIVATVDAERQYKLASDWLYDRKVHSVGRAVDEMCKRVVKDIFNEWYSGAWVDEHMRDQLVIYEALAAGVSCVWPGKTRNSTSSQPREPSLHVQTAKWVVEQMLKVSWTADKECKGIGFGRELEDSLAELKI